MLEISGALASGQLGHDQIIPDEDPQRSVASSDDGDGEDYFGPMGDYESLFTRIFRSFRAGSADFGDSFIHSLIDSPFGTAGIIFSYRGCIPVY